MPVHPEATPNTVCDTSRNLRGFGDARYWASSGRRGDVATGLAPPQGKVTGGWALNAVSSDPTNDPMRSTALQENALGRPDRLQALIGVVVQGVVQRLKQRKQRGVHRSWSTGGFPDRCESDPSNT